MLIGLAHRLTTAVPFFAASKEEVLLSAIAARK
jgi:hypothetical protein